MQIPQEFMMVCRNFIQDLDVIGTTPEEVIRFAIQGLSTEERRVVRRFLDESLQEGRGEAELQGLWSKSGAQVYFRKVGQLRQFLTNMRGMLK